MSPPNFKTYYKAIIIKAVWPASNWHIDQRNRVEGSEINLYIFCHSIFDKEPKILSGERITFSTNGDRIIGCSYAKKAGNNLKLLYYIQKKTPTTKNGS